MNEAIKSLRGDLHAEQTKSSAFIITLAQFSCRLSLIHVYNQSGDLEKTIQELRDSHRIASQQKDDVIETANSVCAQDENSSASIVTIAYASLEGRLACLEQTNQELRVGLAECQHKADCPIRINRAHEQIHHCESLYAQGRIYDAAESFLEMEKTLSKDVRTDKSIVNWRTRELRCPAVE